MDTSRPTSQKRFIEPKHLTDFRISAILSDIELGAPKKYAAEANLISESHFYDAVKQGLTDIKYGEIDTRWARMVESLRKIEMKQIVSCMKDIRESEKGHRGAEWTLEHAYWREFCGDAKILQLAKQVDELVGEANEKQS